MKIKGTIKPLPNKVFVSDMEFGEQRTASGLFIPSANGKSEGISPRWGKVWAVGDGQDEVQVGDWILVEHGRWTRTIEVEQEDGSILEVRMVDNDAIMIKTDEQPTETLYRAL
jgi:co-chaperonin GroES (HSP10)